MAGTPHRTRTRCWRTPVLMVAVLALLATSCSAFGQPDPPSSDGSPSGTNAPAAIPPPSPVANVTAHAGGGSGEVIVEWDRLPPAENVAFYRVYERRGTGRYWQLAIVTSDAPDDQPGRVGLIDAPDYWPWPSIGIGAGPRCYVVTAVSSHGLEGAFSAEVCDSHWG